MLNFGPSFVWKWTKSIQISPWSTSAHLPCWGLRQQTLSILAMVCSPIGKSWMRHCAVSLYAFVHRFDAVVWTENKIIISYSKVLFWIHTAQKIGLKDYTSNILHQWNVLTNWNLAVIHPQSNFRPVTNWIEIHTSVNECLHRCH